MKQNLTKKSKVLFIRRKRNDNTEVDIYLNYIILDVTQTIRFLGINLDKN